MPELHFKGKEFVYNHHLSVPYRPLVIHDDKSVGATHDLNGNLIVHGDNLHALKALLPLYAGKVDCVFIDPPYNTGNEGWCYNDNVNSPMLKEWLASNPVGIEDGLRHDKWCAMMWPRLQLLHELLSDSGAIFITIDDNECHRLRLLMDDIFGENNFMANFVWQSKDTPGNNSSGIAETHNHVLLYRKTESFIGSLLERNADQIANYTNPDGDKRGNWLAAPLTRAEYRVRDDYALPNKVGREVSPPKGSSWRRPPAKMKWLQEDDRIWWGKDGNAEFPMEKKFLTEAKSGVVNQTWWPYEFAGSTRNAGAEMKEIFDGEKPFATPKPRQLIDRILELATDESSVILDSFAGSGTTAHAVLTANTRDGGNRKFILVECEDYADELTAERVRRVINGYNFTGTQREELLRKPLTFTDLKKADKLLDQIASIENLEAHRFDKIEKKLNEGVLLVEGVKAIAERTEGLGGNFTFCTLGEPLDLDGILTGNNLPSYEAIGAWLFHTATGEALNAGGIDMANGYLGESSAFHVWLIYKPELEYLKSRDAALTLNFAETIAKAKPGKNHLVFAPAKYVPNKTLLPLGVEYAPLPFSLYRLEK
ncbi:MAG: site-specific DNA-methyltransferase [Pseudohongiella sp.]|nr:site-specific DNA-methyltransferase [Pseudohongiella sp.]